MAALRRWLLPMFIAVAGVPFTTANQMVSLDSKGMMKAPADGRAHGIYTAVPEISLLARGDIENRRMRTGGDSDDLEFSDNVYASADTGGSTWQAQIEDRQEARAQAIDVAKLRKQADAKARRDAAIRGEIRQQAELQEWQRRERAVGEEAEVAAQRAYAMGHDAEIAAKRAFLMSGGMHGDEWLQSERAEHSRTEHFGVGMHADERLLQAETAVHSRPQEMRVGGMHGLAGWSQEGINEKRALPPERHVRSARGIMRPLDGWSQEGMDDQRAPHQRARSAPSSNEVSHEEMDRQMAPPQHELDLSRNEWNEWSQNRMDQQTASTQRARRPPIMRRAKASPNTEVDDLVRNQWWGHRPGPQNLEHAHEDGWVQASNSLDGEDAHMESNAGGSLYGRGSLNDANSDALANSDVEAIPQQGPPGKLYSQGGPTLRSGLGEMERYRFQNEEAGKSYGQRKRSQISDGMDSVGSGSGSSLVANDAPTAAHAGISTGARPGFGDLQKQSPGSSAAMALTVNSADVTWNEEGQDHLGGSSDGTEGKTPPGGDAAHDDAEGVTDKGAEAMSAPPQWSHEERQATGASISSFQSMPAINSMHDQDIQAILRLQHVLTDEGVQAQSHGNENHAVDFRTFANDADIRYGQPLHENDPEQRNAPTTQGYKLGGSDGWSGSSLPTTVSADYSSDGRSLLEVKAPSPKTGGNEHTSQASIKQVEITSQADIQQVSRYGAKKAMASSKNDQDPQNMARDRAVARAKAIVEAKARAKPVTSANSMAKTKAKPKPCQGKAGCAVSKSKVQVFASGFAAPVSKSDTKVKRAKAKAKLGAKATQASKAEKMAKQVAKAAQAKSQMLAKARNKVKEVAKAKHQAKKSAKKSPKKIVKKSVTKTKAKSRSTRR